MHTCMHARTHTHTQSFDTILEVQDSVHPLTIIELSLFGVLSVKLFLNSIWTHFLTWAPVIDDDEVLSFPFICCNPLPPLSSTGLPL